MSEFADDDFEEDYQGDEPQEEVEREPAKKPVPKRLARRAEPQNSSVHDVDAPKERFSPFAVSSRIGVFDNSERKPFMEASDIQELTLSLLVKLLNDVEEIKQSM